MKNLPVLLYLVLVFGVTLNSLAAAIGSVFHGEHLDCWVVGVGMTPPLVM